MNDKKQELKDTDVKLKVCTFCKSEPVILQADEWHRKRFGCPKNNQECLLGGALFPFTYGHIEMWNTRPESTDREVKILMKKLDDASFGMTIERNGRLKLLKDIDQLKQELEEAKSISKIRLQEKELEQQRYIASYEVIHNLQQEKKDLKSELEKSNWIPVSERLPEKEGIYEVTYEGLFDEEGELYVDHMLYDPKYKRWSMYTKNHSPGGMFIGLANKIIAWKEHSKSYQPQTSTEEGG